MTRVWYVKPEHPDPAALAEAASILRRGGLVAFPTETVYGLGADATSPRAVHGIFQAKGRPPDNPLIVHFAAAGDLPSLSATARRLAASFWPGPLTLVIPRVPAIAPEVSCGLDTLAVRVPDHPVAQGLIRRAGVPLAAPSANRSGRPSPTTGDHVLADLDGRIDGLLDAGPTRVGLESTVLDLTVDPPAVLRPGGISLEDLRRILPETCVAGLAAGPARSPGIRHRHYAPRARVVPVEGAGSGAHAALKAMVIRLRAEGLRVGALLTAELAGADLGADVVRSMGSRADLAAVAAGLYAGLRAVDEAGVDVILVDCDFPSVGLGRAIRDRLARAADLIPGPPPGSGVQ
ncbi:MAG TPA: L-threonylcarbamoyladenylate synthase [Bacillota bacterium]|nr:L-threonylcarbamoyladenylate synthase [Bacillota bacterium]